MKVSYLKALFLRKLSIPENDVNEHDIKHN